MSNFFFFEGFPNLGQNKGGRQTCYGIFHIPYAKKNYILLFFTGEGGVYGD